MPNPNRGEVWITNLGYAAKIRPCLVLSISLQPQDRVLVTLVPHTTSIVGTRFEVDVPVPFLKFGAFDVQQIITIPQVKLIRKLGSLQADQLALVEDAVRVWLAL